MTPRRMSMNYDRYKTLKLNRPEPGISEPGHHLDHSRGVEALDPLVAVDVGTADCPAQRLELFLLVG